MNHVTRKTHTSPGWEDHGTSLRTSVGDLRGVLQKCRRRGTCRAAAVALTTVVAETEEGSSTSGISPSDWRMTFTLRDEGLVNLAPWFSFQNAVEHQNLEAWALLSTAVPLLLDFLKVIHPEYRQGTPQGTDSIGRCWRHI